MGQAFGREAGGSNTILKEMAYLKQNGKQFHQVRHIRLSEENYEWLNTIKNGTWNHTFNKIRQKYESPIHRIIPAEGEIEDIQ